MGDTLSPRESVGGRCVMCDNKRMPVYDVFCGLCRWKFNEALLVAHPHLREKDYG